MSKTVILQWTFSPPHLFEEAINIEKDGYTITINDGKIEARIPDDLFEKNERLRSELHELLNARFLAAQLLNHEPYTLSKSQITKEHKDGKRDIIVEVEPITIKISAGQVDFVLKDKDGNVKTDSRRERIDLRTSLGERVSNLVGSEELLLGILRSYNAAINDTENELVHLYEIREALASRFGGEREAREALGVCGSSWKEFGRICNHEPLRQGRHRGQNLGLLRDATKEELSEARKIAVELIESYLSFLENSKPGSR